MPIRPKTKTYQVASVPIQPPVPPIVFEASDFSAGLITEIHPESIPPNSLQRAENVEFVRNQLVRRNGAKSQPINPPGPTKVLAILSYNDGVNGIGLYRMTPTTVHRLGSSGYTQLTGPTLLAGNSDRISFTVADERGLFANGVNQIQEIHAGSNTYTNLGNSPAYKYITSAFNRIIGASLSGNRIQVGWSGDLNYGEWNPITDTTAGFEPLVNSPSDLDDPITGLVNLDTSLCVIREKSIWFGTNNASATNPFNFYPRIPKIGSDCPGTVILSELGLIFYNYKQGNVYLFDVSDYYGKPVPISNGVRRDIKEDVEDPSLLFGSYNSDSHSYTLFIPKPNADSSFVYGASTVVAWKYNFDNKSWTRNILNDVSCCNNLDYSSSDISLDDLTGTLDNLAGTLDSLGGLIENSNEFIGYTSGFIAQVPLFGVNKGDIANINIDDTNATGFIVNLVLPPFVKDKKSLVFNFFQFQYTPFTTGYMVVLYSKDNGLNWVPVRVFNITDDMLFKSNLFVSKKPIRSRMLTWQIICGSCMASFDGYRAEANLSGIGRSSLL